MIMTPGPVEVDPRILRAMSVHVLGQFDPEFTELMNETMTLLRQVFQTANQQAFPVDGTSRAGLEAVLCSLIEPGDRVLIPIFGRFGHLLTEIAVRCRAEVRNIETQWGSVIQPEQIEEALKKESFKVVAIVHGETSTCMIQPLDEIGRICEKYGALLVVDAVATLGGVEVKVDEWGIDACISGMQKCLSAPSGMAPLTYNDKVGKILEKRKRIEAGLSDGLQNEYSSAVIQSNYLDLAQLQDYWSPRRLNHHTEATVMLYALREALRCVLKEGLKERFERHRVNGEAMTAGIEAMGLEIFGDIRYRMPMVIPVLIPEGIDGKKVKARLLDDFSIEIASSFGPLHGKIWRIGAMGHSSQKRNVLFCIAALEAVLRSEGFNAPAGQGIDAALDVYGRNRAKLKAGD